MVWYKILWTFCAVIGAWIFAYGVWEWSNEILLTTPYQLWPAAGVSIVYSWLLAVAVVGGSLCFIFELWFPRRTPPPSPRPKPEPDDTDDDPYY